MHVWLELRPSSYGTVSKVNQGSFAVIGVERSFSPKLQLLHHPCSSDNARDDNTTIAYASALGALSVLCRFRVR